LGFIFSKKTEYMFEKYIDKKEQVFYNHAKIKTEEEVATWKRS